MPSIGSRYAGSIGVTLSRRRPRLPPTNSETNSSAGAPRIAAGVVVLRQPAAGGEHRDPVAHLHGLVDVVRDQQHRLAQLALEAQELVLQPAADHRVDRAERLVHQQHGRVGGERAGDADALPLATGELVREAVGEHVRVEPDQLHQLDRRGRARRDFDQPSRLGTVATLVAIVWCGNSPTCWIT